MGDSESLSLDESDNFYFNRKLSNITAPSDVLKDVIDSDKEDIDDISKHGTEDRTIAGNESEYKSRWRKRAISPVRAPRSYKERMNEHFKELEEDKEKKEKLAAEKLERALELREEHRKRNEKRRVHDDGKEFKRERSHSRERRHHHRTHSRDD